MVIYEAPFSASHPIPARVLSCVRLSLPVRLKARRLSPRMLVLDGAPPSSRFDIFVAQRAAWHTITDDMPQFEQHDPADRRLTDAS